MVILKTCQSLDKLNKTAGQFLLQQAFKSKVHPGREESFLLGREALRLALCELGKTIDLQNIILKSYDQIEGHPELTLSLSHTEKCGVAALVNRSEFRAIGIDIESEERPIREDVVRKLSHPEDLPLRNIQLWILKEAAFKCLSNSHLLKSPPLFTEIQIGDEFWAHAPTGLSGKWEVHEFKPFLIGLATLSN